MDCSGVEIRVLGGRQKRVETRSTKEWSRFGEAVVLLVDPGVRTITELTYVSPPEVCPEEPSVLFKSGSLSGTTLDLCTQTEVLSYDIKSKTVFDHISLPEFNDVHHVVRTSTGTRLVAITGLDRVVEIDSDGEVVSRWNVLGPDAPDRFDQSIDYRKVPTTKPHSAHPNFVFQLNGDVWSTRFEQRDAVNLSEWGQRIDIGIERPHDGHVVGDAVWFTTVDGHVVSVDAQTLQVRETLDLNELSESEHPLGWLRGLAFVDDEHIVVAFSTLRITSLRQNLRWVKTRFGMLESDRVTPTHLACFNIVERKLVWTHEFEASEVDAIFSVIVSPVSESTVTTVDTPQAK